MTRRWPSCWRSQKMAVISRMKYRSIARGDHLKCLNGSSGDVEEVQDEGRLEELE